MCECGKTCGVRPYCGRAGCVARLASDPQVWQNIESFCPVGALSMPFGWSILGADW